MKKIQILLLLLIALSIIGCKDNSENIEDSDIELTTTDEDGNIVYSDGTYCADVEYYNPDTGFSNSYTLNVDVESNEVVMIHFSSGWLDGSEFSSETIDSNGFCSITCYDGRQFDIQITGSECSFTDVNRASSDDYYEKERVTCPECGEKKHRYDDICDECKDKAEHTCKRCGQHDSFMFSTDDLCSDCKREEENEN